MFFFVAWRRGLFRRIDGEKLRLFFGWTEPLFLSWRRPLWRAVPWGRALFTLKGARQVAGWLEYRVRLYDGEAG